MSNPRGNDYNDMRGFVGMFLFLLFNFRFWFVYAYFSTYIYHFNFDFDLGHYFFFLHFFWIEISFKLMKLYQQWCVSRIFSIFFVFFLLFLSWFLCIFTVAANDGNVSWVCIFFIIRQMHTHRRYIVHKSETKNVM